MEVLFFSIITVHIILVGVMNQKWQGVSSYQYFHYYFWLDFASASLADITQKAMLKCTKVQKVQNWAKCRQLGEGRGEKMKIEEYTFSLESGRELVELEVSRSKNSLCTCTKELHKLCWLLPYAIYFCSYGPREVILLVPKTTPESSCFVLFPMGTPPYGM